MRTVKPQASPPKKRHSQEAPDMRSGLPGTPEEQRRDLRAAIKRHAETLRRLGR